MAAAVKFLLECGLLVDNYFQLPTEQYSHPTTKSVTPVIMQTEIHITTAQLQWKLQIESVLKNIVIEDNNNKLNNISFINSSLKIAKLSQSPSSSWAELVIISTNTDPPDPTRPTRNSTFQSESDTTYKEKVVSLYE